MFGLENQAYILYEYRVILSQSNREDLIDWCSERVPLERKINVECPYIFGKRASYSQRYYRNLSPKEIENLLSIGYRHFGRYFYRPVCQSCGECLPFRTLIKNSKRSKNAKRVHRKNRDLEINLSPAAASAENYELFVKHNAKFLDNSTSSFQHFNSTICVSNQQLTQLSFRHKGRLIAEILYDDLPNGLNFVAGYWDLDMGKRSIGSFGIYTLMDIARDKNLDYVYLGHFNRKHKHLSYKRRYWPAEVLMANGNWKEISSKSNTDGIDLESINLDPRLQIVSNSEAAGC